ncbi:hypothetical protein LCGC14_0603290 [marine sediment metagenome]|uniref:Uncharacterized protein n=1 Tax=marine sediment metagenome TaxID=412755 RepID=A0A0F9RER9_9ZZZZ
MGIQWNAYKYVEDIKRVEKLSEVDFLKELKEKIVKLVYDNGPIIDVIHRPMAYYDVEKLINFLINYFLKSNKECNPITEEGLDIALEVGVATKKSNKEVR